MVEPSHYDTLEVPPGASQNEIKQAYRRLARILHPDRQTETVDADRLSEVNAAYEVLKDPQQRQFYDQTLRSGSSPHRQVHRQKQATVAQQEYRQKHPTGQESDAQILKWRKQVYTPVDRLIGRILRPLKGEVNHLSADPFDDELMANFQAYLKDCRTWFKEAQRIFQSFPNPRALAGAAVHLYYCLDRISDGLDELEGFTLNYNDQHLHTGLEMFRIAAKLRQEARSVSE